MAKKKINKLFIGILIIAVLFAIAILGNFFAVFDDYLTLEDFKVQRDIFNPQQYERNQEYIAEHCSNGVCTDGDWKTSFVADCKTTQNAFNDDTLVIKSHSNYLCGIEYLPDVSDKDLQIRGTLRVYGGTNPASSTIYFGGKNIYSLRGSNQKVFINMVKDFEDETIWNVEVNGFSIGQIPTRTLSLSVQSDGESWFEIDTIKYNFYESCDLEADEIVWTDKFYTGTTFDINDLSHQAVKFCPRERPLIKRNIETGGERANIEGTIYEKLRNGEEITVPEGYVYEVPYGVDFVTGMGSSNCFAGAYKNNAGECIEVIFEQDDVIDFVNEKEFITIGKQDIVIKEDTKIADKWLRVEDATYAGVGIGLAEGEEKDLNSYLKVKYLGDNQYRLTVSNDILSVESDTNSGYVEFADDKNVNLKVTNNLGTFDEAGFEVKIITGILRSEDSELFEVSFDKGTKVYPYKINTGIYEELNYEITPIYKIGGKTFYDDEVIKRNFNIIEDIDAVEEVKVIEETTIVKKSLWSRFIDWLLGLFGR